MARVDGLIGTIRAASKDVYQILGAGYEETVYEEALAVEFRNRGLAYQVERNAEIFYKDQKVGIHRLDFIVENAVVVELKAQPKIARSHVSQTMAYLKNLGLGAAMLVNFPYPETSEPQVEVFKKRNLRTGLKHEKKQQRTKKQQTR